MTSSDTPAAHRPQRAWHTASHTNDRGECVEVAEGPATAVRDSKHRDGTALLFPVAEWRAFVEAAKRDAL